MLNQLFPRDYRRFTALPILGSIANEFAEWLVEERYNKKYLKSLFRQLVEIEEILNQCEIRNLNEINSENFRGQILKFVEKKNAIAWALQALERFVIHKSIISSKFLKTEKVLIPILEEYKCLLSEVRGFSASTIHHHLFDASLFIDYLNYNAKPVKLSEITIYDLELFVRNVSKKYGRGTMQHLVAHLRSFLRFLVMKGVIDKRLDTQIETPRLYRQEKLPRSLDWNVVQKLLQSIDQSTKIGIRDYAILFLIATYGLRACEIVSLNLDDIHWRAGYLQINQRKTSSIITLPLTDQVGVILLNYLRKSRPSLPYREVFLRMRAPKGKLKPTAITEIFQLQVKKSGLNITYQGPHCIRHSYAIFLLRQGVSLKTIGDILGHHTAESTCLYLRLSIDDLRKVALPLPSEENIHSRRGL